MEDAVNLLQGDVNDLSKPRIFYARQLFLHLIEIEQPSKEPLVDSGLLPYAVNCVAFMEGVGNGKYPLVSRLDQFFL
jgi:hypothetical protein